MASTGTGAIPVDRVEMATRDMDVIACLLSQRYVEHRASFRCVAPARVDAGVRAAAAGLLEAAVVRHRGFDYRALVGPPDDFIAWVALHGTGTLATAREQVHFTRGGVFLDPIDLPFAADLFDCAFALLRVRRQVVDELAEQHAGLPAGSLRFESIAPVSGAARGLWSQTVGFLCRRLIGSGITEVSPLVAEQMARLAAAALLETFPNTAMTAAHTKSPGHVAPAAVRRAAAYMDTHAGRPVTLTEVAAVAGTSARALQYAFRRHYDTTPTGYLRRARLERAHRQLQAADPATGATVAQIARRWGWANPAHFATAYRKRYGMPPSHTLRR
jgi:AraC-like DNA-binding protein